MSNVDKNVIIAIIICSLCSYDAKTKSPKGDYGHFESEILYAPNW